MQVKIIDFVMNFNLQVDGEFLNLKVIENSGFTELEYFPKDPANQKELVQELQKVLKKKSLFLNLYDRKKTCKEGWWKLEKAELDEKGKLKGLDKEIKALL